MKVLYFARVAELVGTREETLTEVPATVTTVGALVELLKARNPRFAAAIGDGAWLRVAVNQSFAQMATPVGVHDQVAFFPPMTGG